MLTTFPGVHSEDTIRYVHVDAASSPDGESSTAEVTAVVEAILEHARSRPHESLGVIAFGIKHADRVDAALRDRLAEEPAAVQAFFGETGREQFFVKNLERVQGDERDAIILTVGYGKNADGKVYYRFGPLNLDGGERRLNVAVTRAKRRITVVSSLSSRDLDPNRLSKPGAQLLRQYLQFAESAGTSLGDAARVKPDLNPFELDVLDAIRSLGIAVVPQYGASGYWIDFALQHPTEPGRMVLAVEADGATYHSQPTARDRDRLRQQHLENLGWSFHRIWSTDWFRDRASQVEAIRVAYDAAVARCDAPQARKPEAPAEVPVLDLGARHEGRALPVERPPRGARPPVWPGQPITTYSAEHLVALVAWVCSDGIPRTDDEIMDEMIAALGFRRRGTRIVAALKDAIRRARGV